MEQRNNKEPAWLAMEKIVATLEKFISPNSQVKHNIFLPVIGKPNREPRQIDVAIYTRISENKTHLAIIEVQDRKAKPDITIFGGWIKKMQEVGANQLICVSEAGFPESIIDDVKNTFGHNIVTLMTLKEFDSLLDPQRVNVDFFFDIDEGTFDILAIRQIHVEQSASKYLELGIDTDKRVFDAGDGERLTLRELIRKVMFKVSKTEKFKIERKKYSEFPFLLSLDHNSGVYVYINDEKFLIIKWEIDLKLSINTKPLLTETKKFVYSQQIINGAIAWLISGSVKMSRKTLIIDFLFKTENGELSFETHERLINN